MRLTRRLFGFAGLLSLVQRNKGLGEDQELELARRLTGVETRRAAIKYAIEQAEVLKPLLLRWTESPPTGIYKRGLYKALAEIFGELRATEAIPFLIRNLDELQSYMPIWNKGSDVIIQESPAIRALLRIGKAAVPALISAGAPANRLTFEETLSIVFTLTQLKDPRAKHFLFAVRASAFLLALHAQEGLIMMGEKVDWPSPP